MSEGRGGFIRNAAKMFSFGPIPTRTKKAWSSSTCLLYAYDYNILADFPVKGKHWMKSTIDQWGTLSL